MLNCFTNLFGQNDTTSLKGVSDSLVVIDIATIREANIKLLERNALKEIVEQQDTIIINQSEIIDAYKAENLYLVDENIKLKDEYKELVELNKRLSKKLNCNKLGFYTTSSVLIAIVSYITVNSLVSGK